MAAREIFVDLGPDAPLEEVARCAGVGIGTLYRRFPDRQALQRAVALDVLAQITREAELATSEESESFRALARYMHRAVTLRVGVVMPTLVGQPAVIDAALLAARDRAAAPVQALIDAAHAEGTLRPDVTFGDVGLLIGRLCQPLPGSIPRAAADQLAHRHLDILLDGLRGDRAQPIAPLSGPALMLEDLQAAPRADRGGDT